MSTELQYATFRTSVPRPLWHRAIVIPFYYVGWTIGCGIGGAYTSGVMYGRFDVQWISGPAALWTVGSLCGIGGAALAHLVRRRRWPQVVFAALGVIWAALAAWAVHDMLRAPGGLFWIFFYIIALMMSAGAIATLCGGVAGIVLTRRR